MGQQRDGSENRNLHLDDAQDYDTQREFLDNNFESPDDYPDGIPLIPEWTDDYPEEAPYITDATQVREDFIDYEYKQYHVQIRRPEPFEYEIRVFIDEYDDIDFVRQNHYIEGPGYISKVTSGVVYITIIHFAQHYAYEAAKRFVEQYRDFLDGQEKLHEAMASFEN